MFAQLNVSAVQVFFHVFLATLMENLYLCHKIACYMEKKNLNIMTKEDVLRRYKLSRQKKQRRLRELEEGLRADFKKATGVEASSFVVW